MMAVSPALAQRLKWCAWALIAVGSGFSLWAVWLALHLKENPAARSVMMRDLFIGVLLYMIGRLALVALRWSAKKRGKGL
jgi:hypothetical protein